MKSFGFLVLALSVLIPNLSHAQNEVRVDGEVEFEIGDTKIRIGGNNYDGRDVRSLNERIRRLEYAVRFLMEHQGWRPHARTQWECSIETPFDGIFMARSDSEASARAAVVQKCNQATDNSIWCKSDKAKCSEVK